MNEIENSYEGTIDTSYKSKVLLKIIIGSISFYFGWVLLTELIIMIIDPQLIFLMIILIVTTVILPFPIMLLVANVYLKKYIENFSYSFTKDNIVIHHGVFTKTRATIPYSRIQNINIVNGVFDRMFDIYTVKIETAGATAAAQGGQMRPEGFIPGLKDPEIVEKKMNQMIKEYAGIPSGLEDKVFESKEVAFDNFISYILSKLREGERLKTSIKELRGGAGLSQARLAEKVGVPVQTIQYLEEGRYSPSLILAYKIADALDCKIEDLFQLS